jgi:hypothetical protein
MKIQTISAHHELPAKSYSNESPAVRNYFSAELSGPAGQPIPVQMNPFQVTFTLATDPNQPAEGFQIRPLEPAENGNGERPA